MTTRNPILSDDLYLDAQGEATWCDGGAAQGAAATELALNGAADSTPMAGLIQPIGGPRQLTLTVLDANVGISAFSITVVGKDINGAALTQTFLFAGGLVQVSTDYYNVLTSITLDSLVGESAGDTLNAAWGVAQRLLLPMKDGDYGVGLDKPSRNQQHVIGDRDAIFNVPTRRDLKGPLKIGAFPHLWEHVLSWAMDRDSSNELGSKTLTRTFPGLQSVEHLGMKVNSMTVEGAEDGDVDVSLDLLGCWERPRAGGIVSYPGAYIVPNYPSLVFSNTRVIACLSSSLASAGTRIAPLGVKNYSFTLANNLKPGQPVEDRNTRNKDKRVAFLLAGKQTLTAKMSAFFNSDAYLTLDQDDLYWWFKVIGAHPSYTTSTTVGGAGASAGTSVSVPVADSSSFVVGQAVYFAADSAAAVLAGKLPCVGVVTAKADGTHITIATLDEDVTLADNVYNAGFELRTGPLRCPSAPKTTPYGDLVMVELNGDSFSGGNAQLSRRLSNMAVPS